MTIKTVNQLATGLLFALFSLTAQATTPIKIDGYTVHFNAFNSDTLPPNMAKAYDIVRSKNRGMFTLSVMKDDPGVSPIGKPVHARVKASATNLAGQLRDFTVREIDEGDAIYYISVFHISAEETLAFDIQIAPEDGSKPFAVKFRQKFYTR
ncbi:MAG TPA: DUF4426 domain-containing protein [Gammaproteobacteria bacterium]|nr:DUF4426 domain-containing protein [Gammaproteobacteria bacterium]